MDMTVGSWGVALDCKVMVMLLGTILIIFRVRPYFDERCKFMFTVGIIFNQVARSWLVNILIVNR